MALSKDGTPSTYTDPSSGAEVQVFSSEKDLLEAWLQLLRDYDPDALITFQVRSFLG